MLENFTWFVLFSLMFSLSFLYKFTFNVVGINKISSNIDAFDKKLILGGMWIIVIMWGVITLSFIQFLMK